MLMDSPSSPETKSMNSMTSGFGHKGGHGFLFYRVNDIICACFLSLLTELFSLVWTDDLDIRFSETGPDNTMNTLSASVGKGSNQ